MLDVGGNIGIQQVFIIITALIALTYLVVKELIGGLFHAKILFPARMDTKAKFITIFYILMACFWLYFLIDFITNIGSDYNFYQPLRISIPIMNLLLCVVSIKRCLHHGEIRQKGIVTREGLISFKDILKYSWVDEETVEITYYPINRYITFWSRTSALPVRKEDRGCIDEIFNSYIKPEIKD